MILEDAGQNPFLEDYYRRPEQMALPVQLHFLMTRRKAMQSILSVGYDESSRSVKPHAVTHAQRSRSAKSSNSVASNLDRHGSWVSDFLFNKDRLFAELTLDEKQLALYTQLAAELDFELILPDLVVYLQAPLEVLYDRIEIRGNSFEQTIASSYLARIQHAYTEFFHTYNETPVLIVNASEIDFARNEHDYARLVDQIVSIKAGRHYFNPSPETVPAA